MKQKRIIHRMRPEAAAAVRAARDNAAAGNNAVTPAAVLKAEFPDVIEIAGRTFLPFRLNTLRALQAVKSPIINAVLGTSPREVTDLDGLIAFWIFTTELPVVRDVIGRGQNAVHQAALALGDMLEIGDQFKLGRAVVIHMQSAFVTLLGSAEKDPDLKKVLLAASSSAAKSGSPSPGRRHPVSAPGSATASDGPATTSSDS